MTDEQIVTRLATEVMGWEMVTHGKGYEFLPSMVKDETGYVRTLWDPLSDWNHWRQAELKVMENEKLQNHYFHKVLLDGAYVRGSVLPMFQIFMKADLPTRCRALITALDSLK